MNADGGKIDIEALKESFSDLPSVQKSELRQYFHSLYPDLNEQAFRRILYSLQKRNIITSIGAGIYIVINSSPASEKRRFSPVLSQKTRELSSIIKESFPYTNYLIWETNVLHEFMIHQPGFNHVIVEVERDATESVFNRLVEQFSGTVFLTPDRANFERYVMSNPDSIILLRLVTQSPKMKTDGILTSPLEKILVDIFADEDRFFVFQGQEIVNIFENAFSMYWINEKTLFRYAGRRKATTEIRAFISTQTSIKLSSVAGQFS